MNPLQYLTDLTVVLLIGLICGMISRKLQLPNMLLLLLAGMGLSRLKYNGNLVFDFSHGFLISISVLTLVMIVFDGSSRFKLKELNTFSKFALKVVIIFLILNLTILGVATSYLFNIKNVFLCLIFAAVMSGTDPGAVLTLFKNSTNKVIELLKIESVLNTPIIVLIPFIILDLMELNVNVFSTFVEQVNPFLQQIITGVGTGIVIGIIVFRAMKKFYSENLSPLILITAALLTYILAESLGGNGVLGVSILGIFFGNFYVKEKEVLQEFSSMLASSLEILVFILIGFIVPISIGVDFFLKSMLLFILLIFLRFIAIYLAYLNDHINLKEKIFMSLNATKGIAVAVVAFILSKEKISKYILQDGVRTLTSFDLIEINGTSTLITLMILFIIYSMILASISTKFSKYFIRKKVDEE
ncbi:cation:proton antiporter [Candidatus Woesearchaeota archaeon]|nr:cation:proton antiporter [Candidatus Woesearchaeota archaeon]